MYPYKSNLDPPVFREKTKSSNVISYLLLGCLVIFFIIIIVLLFVNSSTKSNYIAPEECPKLRSNYASFPSVLSNKTTSLYSCSGNPDGYTGNKECVFDNISNVYDAQALCNKYSSSICSAFSYNPSTSQVIFIDAGYNLQQIAVSPGNTQVVDVYYKQT